MIGDAILKRPPTHPLTVGQRHTNVYGTFTVLRQVELIDFLTLAWEHGTMPDPEWFGIPLEELLFYEVRFEPDPPGLNEFVALPVNPARVM